MITFEGVESRADGSSTTPADQLRIGSQDAGIFGRYVRLVMNQMAYRLV